MYLKHFPILICVTSASEHTQVQISVTEYTFPKCAHAKNVNRNCSSWIFYSSFVYQNLIERKINLSQW